MDISTFKPTALDPASTAPMYLQITEHIAAKIRSHLLPAGEKLPPERQLADLFGVSRTTAINAYRKLEEMGLVRTKIGSGTYVSETQAEADPQPVPWHQAMVPQLPSPMASIVRDLVSVDITGDTISLGTGLPDPALYPTAAFTSLFTQHSARLSNADLGHIPTEGYLPLRTLLAANHSRTGIAATAANIAVMSGSMQGLYLMAKVFLNPGDYVIVEAPTYLGALPIFQKAGARILSLPAPGPLQLDLLEDYLIRYRPKLLYIMPTFQNPSGRVLPLAERQALLTLAAKHRLIIIEDDPYGALHYDQPPPPPLKALDPYGGVIYLRTVSKTIFPGLRVGWVVAPEPVIDRLAMEKQYDDLHSANLSQWLLTQFLAEGHLSSHVEMLRAEYKKRRDSAAAALKRYCGDLSFTLPAGGFYFWCKLPPSSAGSRLLLHEAARQGVTFVPGEACYPDSGGDREFRLCFTTNPEPVLQEGIKRLGRALSLLDKNLPSGGRPLIHASRPII